MSSLQLHHTPEPTGQDARGLPAWITDDPKWRYGLKAQHRRTLEVIASRCAETREDGSLVGCAGGQELCDAIGVHRDTFRAHVHRLTELGLLVVLRHGIKLDGAGTLPNLYGIPGQPGALSCAAPRLPLYHKRPAIDAPDHLVQVAVAPGEQAALFAPPVNPGQPHTPASTSSTPQPQTTPPPPPRISAPPRRESQHPPAENLSTPPPRFSAPPPFSHKKNAGASERVPARLEFPDGMGMVGKHQNQSQQEIQPPRVAIARLAPQPRADGLAGSGVLKPDQKNQEDRPRLNDIQRHDLTRPERLVELYHQAARRYPERFDGSPASMLEFWAVAFNALGANNPGAMMAAHLRKPELGKYISNQTEIRAEQALKAWQRQEDQRERQARETIEADPEPLPIQNQATAGKQTALAGKPDDRAQAEEDAAALFFLMRQIPRDHQAPRRRLQELLKHGRGRWTPERYAAAAALLVERQRWPVWIDPPDGSWTKSPDDPAV